MALKPILFLLVTYLGYHYCSTLFENDRFFSHLSTLEREMTFRTEAGFYYMFFKIIVEAPTFLEGWRSLVNDTGTEYPSSINTLQRFNVYPEVVLGKMFRDFRGILEQFDMMKYFKQCYGINRAEGMDQVESCVGAGDLSVFYVNCIFVLSGLMVGFLFLLGCHLSENILGGLLTVSSFFYNHGEATRVQWIPPLRESFSLPFLILQTLLVSQTLKSGPSQSRQTLLVLATFCFALPWQFSQFVLLTQTLSLFGSYSLRFVKLEQITPVLDHVFIGYVISTICQFFNTMLISSMYVATYISFKVVLLLDQTVKVSNKIARFALDVAVFVLIAGLYKAISAWVLQLSDDAHIFHILLAKFTDYKDFHTMLYTCSKAFDFIEMETFFKLTLTLLLPTTLAVLGRLIYVFGATFFPSHKVEEEPTTKPSNKATKAKRKGAATVVSENVDDVSWESHAHLTYHVFQFMCYLGMAVILMRLKLFMTPYMCVLAGLAANNFVLPQNTKSRYVIVFLMLGAMSVQGMINIQKSLVIQGEFNSPQQEELFLWINKRTNPTAVFAGPMPLTANLRLSTSRYIVNHPHYEDQGMRDRTKLVYQIFSRKPGDEVHATLKSLGVEFAVLDKQWCTKNRPRIGCAIPEVWDLEDPLNKDRPTFCDDVPNYSHLFDLVYSNSQYRVLRVK